MLKNDQVPLWIQTSTEPDLVDHGIQERRKVDQ